MDDLHWRSYSLLYRVSYTPVLSLPNMAHIRQSRLDFGLGFKVKVVETFQVVPSPLGSGTPVTGLLALSELSLVPH